MFELYIFVADVSCEAHRQARPGGGCGPSPPHPNHLDLTQRQKSGEGYASPSDVIMPAVYDC